MQGLLLITSLALIYTATGRKLYISQEQYLQEVLARFDLEDCNPVKQPLPTGFCPIAATDKEHAAAKHLPYAQIVGSVLYASIIS
jgi:hypothetical protein